MIICDRCYIIRDLLNQMYYDNRVINQENELFSRKFIHKNLRILRADNL